MLEVSRALWDAREDGDGIVKVPALVYSKRMGPRPPEGGEGRDGRPNMTVSKGGTGDRRKKKRYLKLGLAGPVTFGRAKGGNI